jgi:NAD(P)H dehydrogenase (quinone)
MKQVLVVYYSRTGNTRKLAEAVGQGIESIEGVRSLLRSTEEVTREDFLESAGIVAGSPVYFGTMAAELKKIFEDFVGIRKKMENKVGAAIATGGDASGGKETTLISIIQAMLIYGMLIVGDPMSASGHYGVACVGAPDAGVRHNAEKLGARVASLVSRLA